MVSYKITLKGKQLTIDTVQIGSWIRVSTPNRDWGLKQSKLCIAISRKIRNIDLWNILMKVEKKVTLKMTGYLNMVPRIYIKK